MLEVIGIACVGVLWIVAEPTILLREIIFSRYEGFFRRLFECAMCSTFWIAIIYNLICYGRLDILFAATAAVLAELLCQKLSGGKLI